MTQLRLTVVGDKEFKDRLKATRRDVARLVENAIEAGTLLLEADIKERVGGQHAGGRTRNRSGQLQSSGKGKRGPQNPKRSGPKPILNKRSGDLYRSINRRFRARGADSSGQVGTYIDYGKTHELGLTIQNAFGKGVSIKMPKRPFVAPSLEDNRERILASVRRALRKAVE